MRRNNNPRKKILNDLQDFVEKVKDEFDDMEDDEFLVITNPKNKRVKHVIDEREGVDMPDQGEVTTGMRSLCNHYHVSGTSLFALSRNYDELSEKMDRSQVLQDGDICKNCKDKI